MWYNLLATRMDIHHLRVFAKVFRNRSFSKASEELHLTQPTVSDHMKTLEDELHCRLFQDLYGGPMFTERLNGTEECQGLYLHEDDVSPCSTKCECA